MALGLIALWRGLTASFIIRQSLSIEDTELRRNRRLAFLGTQLSYLHSPPLPIDGPKHKPGEPVEAIGEAGHADHLGRQDEGKRGSNHRHRRLKQVFGCKPPRVVRLDFVQLKLASARESVTVHEKEHDRDREEAAAIEHE